MATKKKLLQAAAGSAGGGDTIDGIEFVRDGSLVRRNGALTGVSDGKTFTFSGWIFSPEADNHTMFSIANSSGSGRFFMQIDDTKKIYFSAYNSSGSTVMRVESVLNQSSSSGGVSDGNWVHIMLSVDMTNTSNRHLYVNGEIPFNVNWSTYNNDNINFNQPRVGVGGAFTDAASSVRLAHIFFDQTYRDLSQASNRELFLDTDYNPASGQGTLNPLVYLPLNDVDSPETNLGTGGAFELFSVGSGNVYTPPRGANQPKATGASVKNPSFFQKSFSGIGVITTKQFTFSGVFSRFNVANTYAWSSNNGQNNNNFNLDMGILTLQNASGSNVANVSIGSYAQGKAFRTPTTKRHVHVSVSLDLTDTSKRHIIVDGVDITNSVTWNAYNNQDIYFDSRIAINGYGGGSQLQDLSIGEFYWDDNYIDLSSSNPFWNTETNRLKSVRQVLDETGNTPRFAMPFEHTDPRHNLGTEGDMGLNGGATGDDRSSSEFWGRTLYTNGANGFLYRDSPVHFSSGTQEVSFVCAFKAGSLQAQKTIYHVEDQVGGSTRFQVRYNSSSFLSYPRLEIKLYNSSGTLVRELVTNEVFSVGLWYNIFFSTNSSGNTFYVYQQDYADYTTSTLATNYNSGGAFDLQGNLSSGCVGIGARYRGSGETPLETFRDGYIGPLYVYNGYIDFQDEAERLKFVESNGQPKDYKTLIENGDIPTPDVLMTFENANDLGNNSGTYGNFSKYSGDAEAGQDVDYTSDIGP